MMADGYTRGVKGATVSKDIWHTAAAETQSFADALSWLLKRSLDAAIAGPAEPLSPHEEGGGFVPVALLSLMLARGKAESQTEGFNDEPPLEVEYTALIRTLMVWHERLREEASTFRQLAKQVKRGRPSARRLANLLNIPRGPSSIAERPSKRLAGRKQKVALTDEQLLIEYQRLSQMNLSPRGKVERMARDYLSKMNMHPTGNQLATYENNIQRRLAEALRTRRKSGQ